MALVSLAEGRASTRVVRGEEKGLDSAGARGFAPSLSFDPHRSRRGGAAAFLFMDKPRTSKRPRGFGLRMAEFSLSQARRPQSQSSALLYPSSPAHLSVSSLKCRTWVILVSKRRKAALLSSRRTLTWKPVGV